MRKGHENDGLCDGCGKGMKTMGDVTDAAEGRGHLRAVNLIRAYIRARYRVLMAALVWVTIFFCLFILCHIPLSALWYPTLLSACIMLLYTVYDYICFVRKHRRLKEAERHIDITTDNLPEACNLIEEDYINLLKNMLYRKNETIADIRMARRDMLEYVTLWSHQIKTPLTALKLTAGDSAEPERTEMLARLFEMEQYVDMMLQFLRMEGEGNDLVLKPYSLRSMVNQAVKYFARIFISKGISVHVKIDEQLSVVTDEKWLVFVLKQLISNALKYTEHGSITISAERFGSASEVFKASAGIRLVIRDTGIGIAAEDIPRIFERGYTGYNGRKDKKATGLGLYLTDCIMHMLGHGIRIASDVGRGTSVELSFSAEDRFSKEKMEGAVYEREKRNED